MRRLIVVLAVLLLAGCMAQPERGELSEISPLFPRTTEPQNLGFEIPDTTHVAYWWDPNGGPYVTEFGNTNTPLYWTMAFYNGFQCPGTPNWKTGQPEVEPITTGIDPGRIFEGERALKLFTFHRCHSAGVLQHFATEPGVEYGLFAKAHYWYSNCSTQPHYTRCALNWDCESCISDNAWLMVGLDPAGGIDPVAPSVVWGASQVIYGEYGGRLGVSAVASDTVMTAFLWGVAPLPLRHNDQYWDDIWLMPILRWYVPLVERGVQ